jgi:hypothetical protein
MGMEHAPNIEPNEGQPLYVASRNEALIAGAQSIAPKKIVDEDLEAKTIAQLKEEIQDLTNKITFTKNYDVPEAHLYPQDEAHQPLAMQLENRKQALAEKMKQTPKGLLQKITGFFSKN